MPTGTALATSDPVDSATVSTTQALVPFTFSTPYTTTNGTNYVVSFEFTSGTGNGTNRIIIGVDSTAPTHAGNFCQGFNAFTATDSIDAVFQINSPLLDKVSGTDSGFVNTVNGTDTDPFVSGQKVSFTVQAGDALASGTYYWRARVIDPSGSNAYSAWSTARSFMVSAGGSLTNTTNFFQFF